MRNHNLGSSIILILTTALFSCKIPGTETGNPADPNDGQHNCGSILMKANSDYQTHCVLPPYPHVVVANFCQKITACYPIEKSTCFKAVLQQPGLKLEVEMDVDTYEQLNRLYREKSVLVETKNMDICLSAVKELDCQSSIMENVIQFENDVPDFSNVHSIHRTDPSCKMMFGWK